MTEISVEAAQAEIVSHFGPLPSERVGLFEALGRVLAEDIIAADAVPPFRNSAMDGYALRAADTATAPVTLRVIGEVAAGGQAREAVPPGAAIRIMTGAPMPPGADAVVRFEETSERLPPAERPAPAEVLIETIATLGQNVREAGEDIQAGQRVLEAGRRLRPAEVGLLASLGCAGVAVVRRPRVAILSTGDELLPIEAPLSPGKIRNSNEYTLAALVQQAGGIPIPLGIARDTVADLTAKVRAGLAQGVDLFLTSAGVSVGDYDLVKHVLASEGEMAFWQVAIKPGKPLAFGFLGDGARRVPLLGLPGNPVAAIVAFHVFARPAIRAMGGRPPWQRATRRARLQEAVENSGRRHYMRARVTYDPQRDEYLVTTRGSGVQVQGSGILSSLAWANAFLVVPEETLHIPPGSVVEVEMIDWPEEVF